MNEDYHKYEEEDFLLDESFAKYCLGTDIVAAKFWQDWLEKHPEKHETVKRAKELFLLLSGNHSPEQFRHHEQQFRSRFQQHLRMAQADLPTPQQNKKTRLLRTSAHPVFIVSILVIISAITLWLVRRESSPVKPAPEVSLSETAAGEHKFLRLPDGTTITLNAGTKMRVLPSFNETLREITLDGEALLDVAHNPSKPFILHTSAMDIKVLGTVLDVRAYSDDKKSETTLLRGRVEVTLNAPDRKTVILHPNQKIVVIKDMDELKKGKTDRYPRHDERIYEVKTLNSSRSDSTVNEILWASSKLVFDNDNLEDIALTLSREFGYSITVADTLKAYRYTGTFDNKSIEDILNALQLSQHFDYKILPGKKIVIEIKQN